MSTRYRGQARQILYFFLRFYKKAQKYIVLSRLMWYNVKRRTYKKYHKKSCKKLFLIGVIAMTWGSFGIVHITTLVIAAGIITGLYFILKKLPTLVQTIVMGVLSISGLAAIVFNLTSWNSPLEYLPFHLCSLNALVLPVAVFTKSRILNNLLLLWAFGSLAALVVNTAQADFEVFSPTFAFYFFPHTFEAGIPLLMFLLGHAKRDVRCIASTLIITLAVYTGVHLINVFLNAHCIENRLKDPSGALIQVNYMYSIKPENPVLQFFYDLVPQPFFYMLPAIPLVMLYLGSIYSDKLFPPKATTAVPRKK